MPPRTHIWNWFLCAQHDDWMRIDLPITWRVGLMSVKVIPNDMICQECYEADESK